MWSIFREVLAVSAKTLDVLYQDNHLIAVYKPAGLLTQGDQTGDPNLLDEVKAWIAREYDKPGRVFLGLLHRLDRPVSGVVVFARTSKAAARMSKLFRERAIEKVYRARLQGVMQPAAGRLVHQLERDQTGLSVRVCARATADSREASLRYRTLWSSARDCIVEVQLETGRKHQIRAQFAHMGHPILGDRRYGSTRAFSGPGIALSAVKLTFEHPISKRALVIELPPQLLAVPADGRTTTRS
jgi:23S rRNA pseudouridine1911/1915/1917 synthase